MSQFRFEEFNPRRHMRGAEAARVTWVNDQGEEDTLWMSPADIRSNVLLHGPHYGLLVAASHYHMKADQLVALHRSKGKNKTFLQPVEVVPSSTGVWSHPHFPVESYGDATGVNINAWLHAVGYQDMIRCYDQSLGWADGWEKFAGTANPGAWPLEAPEGDGWFIGRIRDHRGGPVCVWLRKLEVA